jgi:hypothetical protein
LVNGEVKIKQGGKMKKKHHASSEAQLFMKKHTKHHIEDLGMSKAQAVAVSYAEARKKGFKV